MSRCVGSAGRSPTTGASPTGAVAGSLAGTSGADAGSLGGSGEGAGASCAESGAAPHTSAAAIRAETCFTTEEKHSRTIPSRLTAPRAGPYSSPKGPQLVKLVVAALAFVSACSLDPVDLAGKECPCGAGWRCDFASSRCVLDLQRDASSGTDAHSARDGSGALDAPLPDTGVRADAGAMPDALVSSDATIADSDTAPVDAGEVDTFFLEAEAAELTAPMEVADDPLASGGQFVTTAPSVPDSTASPPAMGGAVFRFTVGADDRYTVWARVLTPDGSADSFYVRMDSEAWDPWHPPIDPAWRWVEERSYALTAGPHAIEIRYRETPAGLDEIALSRDPAFVPTGLGE